MSQDPVIHQFERVLRLLKNQRAEDDNASAHMEREAGDCAAIDHIVPFQEKRVGDLRYSQQAKIHGNPWGMSKGVRMLRTRLIEEHQQRLARASSDAHVATYKATDALAYALDAERLLGSFTRVGDDPFPTSGIDEVAVNLVVWLEERGFEIRPIPEDEVGD